MRILLDNCVPADLAAHIRGHEIANVIDQGWADLADGPLLDAMAGQFDVLLTVDKSLPFQQMLKGRPIAVVVLRAQSNRVSHLARLVPVWHRTLRAIEPGKVYEVP